MVSRRLNPTATAVVTVGAFHAGSAFNIIADKAVIGGTVRYLDTHVQDIVMEEMERILKGVTLGHDANYTLDCFKGYPPVINHTKEALQVLEASKNVSSVDTAEEIIPVM